ncbi:MAG: sigma-70 family RNA polymerase sigma factor [Planctomycetes bacterium]|nr:sigma-70 family RNA polymerase sigma factor [Planctomycetota bacterium]
MFVRSADAAFRRFRATGDPRALAQVFDATAPELLRLARHLASEEAGAEDLVQSTFVTAIEARTDHDGARPVLPWLCGVLANHARVARRRAKRAVDPRRLPGEVAIDPRDLAEANELRDELARAIDALPEPYRPVLRLSLEHGLDPLEISQTLERPPGTVRAQLSRGLDRLRRALPAGVSAGAVAVAVPGRGLAAVRENVLSRIGEPLVAGAGFGSIGVLLVMTTKLLCGAGALFAAAGLVWYLAASDPRDESAPSAAAARDVSPRSAAIAEPSPREVVAGDATAASRSNDAVSQHAVEVRALTVRVVHARDGAPAAGLAVRLLELDRPAELDAQSASQVTDTDGRARFEQPPDGTVLVDVDRAGTVRAVDVAERGDSSVEVVLPAGLEVHGRVVDAAGNVVAGATILAHGVAFEPSTIARSDARGEFVILDVQPRLALSALAPSHASSLGHPLNGTAGERIDLELRLGGAVRRAVGHVVASDGALVSAALVAAIPSQAELPSNHTPSPRPLCTRTGASGNFEIDVPADQAVTLIAVPSSGSDDAPACAVLDAGTGDAAVDVFLRKGATVLGRVHAAGEAKGGVLVHAFAYAPEQPIGWLVNVLGTRSARTDANGGFRLSGLLPGGQQFAVRSPDGEAATTFDLAEGQQADWDVDLAAGLTLRARVEVPSETGGSARQLFWNARLLRVTPAGEREFVAFQPLGEGGRVNFGNLARGEYELVVGASSIAPDGARSDLALASVGPVRPDGDELVVRVAPDRLPRATLRGRLVDGSQQPRARVEIHAWTAGVPQISGCTTTTDADGRFELAPLVAGDWFLATDPTARQVVARATALAATERRELGDLVVR